MTDLPSDDLWAHTPTDGQSPHLLSDHLTATARLARDFAERLGLADLGELLGLWHDVGKAHPGFQQYLRDLSAGREATSVPHAIWGAVVAAGFRRAKGPSPAPPSFRGGED